MRNFFKYVYFIIVFMAIFFVANIAEATKVGEFLKTYQTEFYENDKVLIAGSIIANYHDSTDVYVKDVPLYHESFTTEDYDITISIYPLVQFKGDEAKNAMAFLISDLRIEDEAARLIDEEMHTIRANIVFDKNILLNDKHIGEVTEVFVNTFENHTKLLVIEQDKLLSEDTYAQYKEITISYELNSGISTELVMLSNSELSNKILEDKFDETYQRDIVEVNNANSDLLGTYGLTDYENQEDIYYNPDFIPTLKSFNSVYYSYIGVTLGIVIIITYFLFFHKYVMKKINAKKAIEQDKYLEIKKKMLNEETIDDMDNSK